MLYVIVVSLLLSVAAFVAERGARISRKSSRWIWACTIIASLLIPSVIASVTIQLPSLSTPTATPASAQRSIQLREMTSNYLSPAMWVAPYASKSIAWKNSDQSVKRAWWVMSGVMLIALALSGIHLFWRKRRWAMTSIMGTRVYVAPDVGPAVVGLMRSRIVIPSWLTESPPSRQAAVLAHELSHLKAGDQQLLTVALCLLVFMPWNLPLWWQLRRLRYAIEVDCDRRVVDGGHDVRDYGETLIEIGQRQSVFIGAVAAMSESKSFLQERIEIMVYQPFKWWRLSAGALICLAIGFAAIAAEVSPPNATNAVANPQNQAQVTLDSTVLDRYLGFYQLSGKSLITVTRQGDHLFAELTGQPSFEIFASSETEFFYKVVDAQITFVRDSAGTTTGLVLHQNGQNLKAPHIDAATAEQIKGALAAKIKSQKASPGTEDALRRLIAGIERNSPNYEEMSLMMAKVTKEQLPMLHATEVGFGPLISIEFNGVGTQGWDAYDVKHANGVAHWRLILDAEGKIAAAVVLPSDLPITSGP
jgi:hypothetical protein